MTGRDETQTQQARGLSQTMLDALRGVRDHASYVPPTVTLQALLRRELVREVPPKHNVRAFWTVALTQAGTELLTSMDVHEPTQQQEQQYIGRTGTTRHGERVVAVCTAMSPGRICVVPLRADGTINTDAETFSPMLAHVEWDAPDPTLYRGERIERAWVAATGELVGLIGVTSKGQADVHRSDGSVDRVPVATLTSTAPTTR